MLLVNIILGADWILDNFLKVNAKKILFSTRLNDTVQKVAPMPIKPLGKQFEPFGDLTFIVAYEAYKKLVKEVLDFGVKVIIFENFKQIEELRVAIIAAREITSLPIICSVEFGIRGQTVSGTTPAVAEYILKSFALDAICDISSNNKILDYVKEIKAKTSVKKKESCKTKTNVITSNTKFLTIEDNKKYNIGRLNSKSDNTFYNELLRGNYNFVIDKILFLNSKGYDAIYINVDRNSSKNDYFLSDFIKMAQSYINLPFIIESDNVRALDYALKIYKGVAGVIIQNNYKKEVKDIFKRYGSVQLSEDILFGG